jgi:predicted metallo-beta-lactamase superfamily hydrolase
MKKASLAISGAACAVASILMGASQSSNADYVSHAFIDAGVEQSQCIQAGIDAAKAIGIMDARVTEGNFVVYGMDSEGYSVQFTCVARKGSAYVIVNGPNSNKRGNLTNAYKNEVNKAISVIKSAE